MEKFFVMIIVVVFLPCAVFAADMQSALSLAVANLPPDGSNAAMGNCWVATPNFGSNSPAVTVMYPSDVKFSASTAYTLVNFKNGLDFSIFQGSILGRLPGGSALQVSYADGSSNTLRESGEEAEWKMKFHSLPVLDVQYGANVAKDLFLKGDVLFAGVGYLYSESKMTAGSMASSPTPWESKLISKTTSHAVSGGITYQPVKKVTLGGFYRHSWDKSMEDITLDRTLLEASFSRSSSDQLRIGASVQITSLTLLALDYQHITFSFADRQSRFDQWFAGIEQGIVKDFLYLYGGWAADGPTTGIGLYFPKGGVNVSYINDYSRDLKPYFGRSEIIMASVYINF